MTQGHRLDAQTLAGRLLVLGTCSIHNQRKHALFIALPGDLAACACSAHLVDHLHDLHSTIGMLCL